MATFHRNLKFFDGWWIEGWIKGWIEGWIEGWIKGWIFSFGIADVSIGNDQFPVAFFERFIMNLGLFQFLRFF